MNPDCNCVFYPEIPFAGRYSRTTHRLENAIVRMVIRGCLSFTESAELLEGKLSRQVVGQIYHRRVQELETDPTDCIDSPKLPEHVPTVLTLDEVNRVIAATDPTTCDGQRNRAILETLYSCGLRVSELTELRIGHIYEKEGFIQVLGKGRKERIVPIAESALREIHNYYIFRNELDVKRGFEDYVFLNRFGRKLSRIMVFNIVKRYCQEANVQKEVSPHTFRHTFATHLLEGGANLRAIQMMLGHEQISTTEIYTKVDRQMLREEILTYHPRNKIR